MISTLAAAYSGIQSAQVRHANSAYNVANLLTEDYRNVRTIQRELPEGGSEAITVREAAPSEVDLAREFTEEALAKTQLYAAVDVIRTQQSMTGTLLDIFA